MAKQKEYYKKTKIEDKNENKKPIAQVQKDLSIFMMVVVDSLKQKNN